jgi:NAD(P)-dependent dehydrogenase (short-subunit alcohol dehydrogenase family)
VLLVNAGVGKFAPLTETSENLYDEIFDIDTKGAYFTIQKAVPYLNRRSLVHPERLGRGQERPAGNECL